ncbi:hypothetical protein ACFYST_08215 [Kitasatospora sp. NPDC004614]|uniref:hypothetical protein n=1 Tax=unclassified Kitasatospora TaxID=2633591 RepID=UPI0036A432B2
MLSQEAGLSAQSIGIGLTYLRKSNSHYPGLYYGAFFNYTIGLERLIKLTLLVNHRVHLGAFPDSASFGKAYGHDLRKLLEAVGDVRSSMGSDRFKWELPDSPLIGVIVGILADFARFDRYHGLDVLTGSTKAKPMDPIGRWYSEVGKPLLAGRSARQVARRERDSALSDFMLRDQVVVMGGMFTETGDALSTPGEIFGAKMDSEYVAQQTTFLCAAIARYVADVLCVLNDDVRGGEVLIPEFSEFFYAFCGNDARLKSRKTFNP